MIFAILYVASLQFPFYAEKDWHSDWLSDSYLVILWAGTAAWSLTAASVCCSAELAWRGPRRERCPRHCGEQNVFLYLNTSPRFPLLFISSLVIPRQAATVTSYCRPCTHFVACLLLPLTFPEDTEARTIFSKCKLSDASLLLRILQRHPARLRTVSKAFL